MNHLFAPYELALALKEKGMDEPCIYYWFPNEDRSKEHILILGDTFLPKQFESVRQSYEKGYFQLTIPAPFHQQVIDFFREKHGIDIAIVASLYEDGIKRYSARVTTPTFTPILYELGEITKDYNQLLAESREDYYEALNEAITHAISLLP